MHRGLEPFILIARWATKAAGLPLVVSRPSLARRTREVVLSTTRVVFLAAMVAALGIGLWGAVGFASPKDNDDGHHDNDKGHSTLTVLTKTRQEKVVDLH